MSAKSFGLDISKTSIRAVSLLRQKNGFLLESSSVISSPTKGMTSSSLIDEQEMTAALKHVVSNAKIKSKNVNIALPEDKVYTSVVELPALSDSEIASALKWEAEQYIPVPLSEIHLVWTLLRKDERARVLMIGAPISLIGRYQKIIGAAGLNISSIETETLSVIRALVRGKFPHAIIINVAEEISSLAIVNEGVLMFTYSIPIGGKAINRALELDYGLSNAQSEEYKMTYGISKEGLGDKIRQAVEPVLFSILNETKKALDFYTQKNKESSPIQQIILSGGTAIIPGVDLFFAENIGIETVIADPWQVLVDKNVPKELLEEASSYTIAVGLAMRAYE
ncbi:MAG: hypothetical protein A2687_02200 [Candidatus Levybacteria bacterium RIFCSPHIGHO2_01_FULL_38_26]|nr:MAG: hypothetical protein A2687_02200 [Candidatus Levybacteria bacterium RIFCSPHIGHO2_01_FULL_38_26]